LDLVRDTRLAYADYVAASEQAEVADRIADLAEEIAELNSRRLEAGDISELDLTLIRLEALAARDQAARLGQESEIGWERLRLIAGLPTATSASPPEGEVIALEEPRPAVELMEMATQSRPDLRAAELSLEAAGKRIGWERSKTFAVVSLLLSSKEVGDAGVKSGPGLSAEVPIFNYGQGRISRAVAEFEQLSLRYAALHVQIESETAGATARLQQAGSALRRLQNDLLPAAEEAVRLADEAYQSGDISYLDLQVARRPFLDLQLREGAAVAAARKAKAELDRAVGRNL
jgi:cobalt-zinc-cadmium efflux system outer membrane protein